MLRARIIKTEEKTITIEFVDGQHLIVDRSLFKGQIKEGDEVFVHVGSTDEEISKSILNTLLGN